MATVKALIRKKKINTDGNCLIFIRYGHKQKVIDISSGIKVKPSNWNGDKEKINSINGFNKNKSNESLISNLSKNDLLCNARLENLKIDLLKIARSLELENIEPTTKIVKSKFLEIQFSKGNELNGQNSLLINDLLEDFISKSNKSQATKANYRTAYFHLQKYQKAKKKVLNIDDISLGLFDDLKHFLYNELRKPDGELGLSDNSVATTIKNIKVFLTHLKQRNFPIPDISSKLKAKRTTTPIYFLNEQELDKLESFNYFMEKYEKVRDVFLFNCYTGLRYSDLKRLSRNHIIENTIQLRAYKNQKDIFVPITKKPKEILQKYDYKLPVISEQKFNDYIKVCCKMAGINQMVEVIKTKSGNKTYSQAPKWQLITSHIAIKTFISLCGKKGISPKIVSEITGKSVEVIIKHYYGIDQKTIKEQMIRAFGGA